MEVSVDIDEAEVENDDGRTIDGLCVTCEQCGHSVEVLGTTNASASYAAACLARECPKGERNFYDVAWWT
jgi:hypothetical protein